MIKTYYRIAEPRRQLTHSAPSLFLPVLSVVNPTSKQALKLIIADDNPHARHGLRAMLASQPDMEVVGEASQGDEAIALAETLHPDVAIMDVRMPVMDGIQAACAIKNRRTQTRVILISMYAEYQTEALAIGADAFLVKGCPAEELIAAIINQKPTSPRFA